jgi:hypothetical protein
MQLLYVHHSVLPGGDFPEAPIGCGGFCVHTT